MDIEQNKIDNEEISLKEIFSIVKDWLSFLKLKFKLILFFSLFGGIFGFIYGLYEKPIYKATLTFAMEEDKGGGAGGGLSGAIGLASSFGIDLGGAGGGGAFAASNLAELMKSRLILEKVLLSPIEISDKTTSLIDFYIEFNQLKEKWGNNTKLKSIKFPPNSNPSRFSFEQDSIFQKIHEKLIDNDHLSITQKDKKVTILFIDVKSENELFSKIFCENIARETSKFYIETKSRKAKINTEVLQRQVDSVRKSLNNAINNVAAETDNVYNLNPALNIKAAATKKMQIDVQANTAILTNLVVQLELAQITLRKETPLIQLIDSPKLPLKKDKTGKIKASVIGFLLAFILTTIFVSVKRTYLKLISR